jgi:hypothetical protein
VEVFEPLDAASLISRKVKWGRFRERTIALVHALRSEER